jgi:glutamyl-tRNA synthetase
VGDIPEYSVDTLCGKLTREKALAVVTDVYKWMSSTNNVDEFERFCREDLTSKYGLKLGTIAHPIRVSITGKTVSLPLFETMEVIGRELCLQRLELSIKKLKGDIPEL